MKKLFICLSIVLAACSSPEQKVNNAKLDSPATDSLINNGGASGNIAHKEGARLIAANDCLTCHTLTKKNIGPSYQAIANRYDSTEGNVTTLAFKIIKGGKGAWDSIPMTPHPNLAEPDAQEMVRYVLSLRK